MRVAAEVEKHDLRSQHFRRGTRLRFALIRGAVGSRFAARANAKKNLATARRLREENPADGKLNVIRMRADSEDPEGACSHAQE